MKTKFLVILGMISTVISTTPVFSSNQADNCVNLADKKQIQQCFNKDKNRNCTVVCIDKSTRQLSKPISTPYNSAIITVRTTKKIPPAETKQTVCVMPMQQGEEFTKAIMKYKKGYETKHQENPDEKLTSWPGKSKYENLLSKYLQEGTCVDKD